MTEWVGAHMALDTDDLQNLRAHMGSGLSFVVCDGEQYAQVLGQMKQPARITSKGVVCDVKLSSDDMQRMNGLTKRIAEYGKNIRVKRRFWS